MSHQVTKCGLRLCSNRKSRVELLPASVPHSFTTKSDGVWFPPGYGASRVVQEGNAHLQGQTCWVQFLDHHGAVRPVLREQLFANLATVDRHRLWAAFPVPTYTVQAPIQACYELYQVGTQP